MANRMPIYAIIGAVLGAVIAFATDSTPIGIALDNHVAGIGIGIAIGIALAISLRPRDGNTVGDDS